MENRKGNICPGTKPYLSRDALLIKDLLDNAKNGDGSLIQCFACSYPNINTVQFLLERGIKIDHQYNNGDTALHLIADNYHTRKAETQVNNLKMIRLLLKNGANRDIRNNKGLTPIQVGLFTGNLDVAEEFLQEEDKLPNTTELDKNHRCQHMAKCLLREGNYCNVPSTNYSVILHFLTLQNDEETFEFVVNNSKFDVNAVYKKCNLLNLVIYKGTSRMITALVNVGADLDAEFPYNGETPLIAAIKNTRVDIVRFLLDSGVSANKSLTIPYIMPCSLRRMIDNKPSLEDKPPLYFAIYKQNFEIVENLLKMGADVNAPMSGWPTLLMACSLSTESDKWPDPHSRRLYRKDFGLPKTTPIFDGHEKESRIKIVEILLDYGVDIEAKDASNRTALDQACKFGKLDTVKLLLSRGAKINKEYVSTLHHAVRGQNPDIVRLVLEKGADVNYRCAPRIMLRERIPMYWVDLPLVTPLECVIHMIEKDYICKNVVEVLMEYGANVNIAFSAREESPLHLAYLSNTSKPEYDLSCSMESRAATIKLLLENSANVNALDCEGLVPLNYAIRNYKLMSKKISKSTDFKPDLVALIAFIAIKIENKESVIEQNLALLEDESARPIFEECKNELSLMKRNIFESNNFSFFNVLSKHIQTVGSALQKKELLDVLNTGEYKENFPIYADYLEHRIRKARSSHRLVNLSILLFQKHISKIILVELTLTIFKFLDLHDFKNFTKACFINVE